VRYGLDLVSVRKYLSSLEQHITAVQAYGALLKVPDAQLFIHDESKWSDAEFPAYTRKFGQGIDDPTDFATAFLHHLHANAHHWQHWLIPNAAEPPTAIEMPEPYVREMVADWLGAGAVYNPDRNPQIWLNENAGRMLFHPITVQRLRYILPEVGLRWPS
jgi:hypothetical protein